MSPDMLVEHTNLGLGQTLPQKPSTPPGYVRVQFRTAGEFTVREDTLRIVALEGQDRT